MAVEALMNNPQGAMPMEQKHLCNSYTLQPQPLNINPQEFQNAIQNLSPAAMQALDTFNSFC